MVFGPNLPFGALLASSLGPTGTDDVAMPRYIQPTQVPHVTSIPTR